MPSFAQRVAEQIEPRTWLFGLTADEWLHLTSEGDRSEVAPCCGNIGALRDDLRMFTWFQGPGDGAWQKMAGAQVLRDVEADGGSHGLDDRMRFPLLNRVLDGIRRQAADAEGSIGCSAGTLSSTKGSGKSARPLGLCPS